MKRLLLIIGGMATVRQNTFEFNVVLAAIQCFDSQTHAGRQDVGAATTQTVIQLIGIRKTLPEILFLKAFSL